MDKGISMIIPAYNAGKYLDLSVCSVLKQTYKDFELIIVDDGSKDNTLEIGRKYATIDNRVKIIHKENGGVSSARNYGIDKITKEYVMFMDADDYIESSYMQRHIEIAEKGYDYVVSGFYNIDRDSFLKEGKKCRPTKISVWKENIDAPDFTSLCSKFHKLDHVPSFMSPVYAKLYKSSIINKYQLKYTDMSPEDHIFSYEYMKYINSCYALNWIGYYYIQGNEEHLAGNHKIISDYANIQYMMKQYQYLINRFDVTDECYINNVRWRYINRIRSLAFKGYFPETHKSFKGRMQVWNTISHDDIVCSTKISFIMKNFHDKSMSVVLMLAHARLYYLADFFVRSVIKLRK